MEKGTRTLMLILLQQTTRGHQKVQEGEKGEEEQQ